MGIAPAGGRVDVRRRRLLGVLLALLAVATAVVLLAGTPQVLVALTSDRDGRPLLPVSTLAPGSASTGELTLANEGLLPLRYDLRVMGGRAEMSSGVILRVRRNDTAGYLYQGPLSAAPIPIGTLAPGQRDRLEVTLAAPPSQETASIPVDDTFVWTAHTPGLGSWWWLLLVVACLVTGSFLGPRMLALWARLRSQRISAELYWRPPLVLSAVLLTTLLPLSGVSLSAASPQTINPAGRFGVGALVLSDRAPAGTACLSVSASSQPAEAPARCSAVFALDRQAPGESRTGRVAIRNVGTVPVAGLGLSTAGCDSTPAPGTPFHGTDDACAAVLMTLHDDRHDVCYFPVPGPGACSFAASGSLRAFAGAHGPDRPLALDPEGLGSGITYSLGVEVDPGAGNEAQGLASLIDFDWRIAQ